MQTQAFDLTGTTLARLPQPSECWGIPRGPLRFHADMGAAFERRMGHMTRDRHCRLCGNPAVEEVCDGTMREIVERRVRLVTVASSLECESRTD
jgi:hypothetical protein